MKPFIYSCKIYFLTLRINTYMPLRVNLMIEGNKTATRTGLKISNNYTPHVVPVRYLGKTKNLVETYTWD
jgi:hypothetical protein